MICRNCGGEIYEEIIEEPRYGRIEIRICQSCHRSSNAAYLRKSNKEAAHKWKESILGKPLA